MDEVIVEHTVMEALIVESGEALGLARELAERRGTSVDDAVVASLRSALREIPQVRLSSAQHARVPSSEELTADQRSRYESLRAYIREIATYKVSGATSDHDDMYDDRGLPI